MNKTLVLVVLGLALASAQLEELCASPTDGYVRANNVCQKCHLSCKTCNGTASTNCLSCWGNEILTNGSCGCTSAGTSEPTGTSGDRVTTCAAAAASSEAQCPKGWWFSTNTCSRCNDLCDDCAATATSCLNTAAGCWAGVTGNGDTCGYSSTTAYVVGSTSVWDQSGNTSALIEGYFYHTTSFRLEPCAVGCLTCAAAGACSSCDSGYALNANSSACECAAGSYEVTSDQTCAACPSGCTACTTASVCTSCDSDHTLSTADSTCVANATTGTETTTDTTATTSGETPTANSDANVASNIAPASGCHADLKGCTACSSDDQNKCTACAGSYNQELNTTHHVCVCKAGYLRDANGGCGTVCTATCTSGQLCILEGSVHTCKAASDAVKAVGTTDTTASGILITAASMILAVILA